MAYLKPQSPLYHKKEDTYFYPLTTVDQVIMDDGSRLGGFNLLSVDKNDANEGEPNLVNADTLGGIPAEEYVTIHNIPSTNNTLKAGFIYPLASMTVPEGFLLCDGTAYNRAEYPELFAAIGTMYGAGNGSTTFNVPNLQTRVPVGAGEGYELGSTGGEAEHTLTVDEMPSHTHNVPYNISSTTSGSAAYRLTSPESGTATIRANGGDQPHNNMQPYTVVHYIIATGKDTGVSVTDIITGVQALPLGIEYGGTGATDVATARENLEITPENIGAMSMELLWENASPESEFTEQTIDLELSTYTHILIEFKHGSFYGPHATLSALGKVGGIIQLCPITLNTSFYRTAFREVIINADNINFTSAFIIYYQSSNWIQKEDSRYCVPTKIYGIKGVN